MLLGQLRAAASHAPRAASRAAGSSLRASPLRAPLAPPLQPWRRLCWARTDDVHLDPDVPSPDRVLEATLREQHGQHKCKALREAGRTPCSLVGDRLPYVSLSIDTAALLPFVRRTHCQRGRVD